MKYIVAHYWHSGLSIDSTGDRIRHLPNLKESVTATILDDTVLLPPIWHWLVAQLAT